MTAALSHRSPHFAGQAVVLLAAAVVLFGAEVSQAAPRSVTGLLSELQSKAVKIHGVGGPKGLEPYQSGFLISGKGHILTAWSYVLDCDYPTVILNDGRRFDARLVGADPRLEVAVLKIDATDLPHFDPSRAIDVRPGTRVLALSNLFNVATGNEPVSVQHGVISVEAPLKARRGVFDTPYDGPVYVIDAMTNNPGAAGGMLVTRRGRLTGILGKELRNTANHTWLNYAVPIREVRESVEQILAGKFVAKPTEKTRKPKDPITLRDLGIVMVPEVLPRTPPYIDLVRANSPARRVGVRPDDLVVLVNDRLIQSCRMLGEELEMIDRGDSLRLIVMRDGRLVEFTLAAGERKNRPPAKRPDAKQ
jgi:serine protease Do